MIDRQFIADSPREIGLDAARLQRVYDYVQTQIDEGLPSAQVAIGRHGKVAEVRTFGTVTRGGVTGPATEDTLYCLYSAAKGTTGVGAWSLIEDGLLRLDERVADIVPEFAGWDKDEITVEQLVTFTCGFPSAPMHPRLWEDRAARLERIKGWRLNWEPGSRYQYHPTSAQWVFVEIITNRTGLDFRDYLRTRLYEPMGVPDLHLGIPDALHARAADVVYVEPPVEPENGWGETNPDTVLHFNLPSQRRAGCPSAGAFTGAGDIALFYQRLVSPQESGEYAVLKPETIEYATQIRTKPWQTDGERPANRAVFLVVAGEKGIPDRPYAPNASPRAFGHGGAGGQLAWGDPETGLSVGFVTNGFAPQERIRERGRTINRLAEECLL